MYRIPAFKVVALEAVSLVFAYKVVNTVPHPIKITMGVWLIILLQWLLFVDDLSEVFAAVLVVHFQIVTELGWDCWVWFGIFAGYRLQFFERAHRGLDVLLVCWIDYERMCQMFVNARPNWYSASSTTVTVVNVHFFASSIAS